MSAQQANVTEGAAVQRCTLQPHSDAENTGFKSPTSAGSRLQLRAHSPASICTVIMIIHSTALVMQGRAPMRLSRPGHGGMAAH